VPTGKSFHALCDATIFTGEAWIEDHALLVADNRITDIVPNRHVSQGVHKMSLGGKLLAPGFIDAQVNGGGNVLFNNAPTVAAIRTIANAHRASGTTHILPTLITDTANITCRAIAAAREARAEDKTILGIHIEGPHISVDARGVHDMKSIRPFTAEELDLYRRQADEIILLTVAPENISPTQIRALHDAGALVSLGHTMASPEKLHEALDDGATCFTHLFNGMGGLTARAPGPAGIALDDRQSFCSIIADGHHVAPAMIRLALRAKPAGRLFLVSDAMAPAGMEHPQAFALYGQEIRVDGGRCINHEGKLAGSAITLADAVRHCVNVVGIDLDETLRMASTYPATFLGLGGSLGKLLPGFDASVIALDPDLKVIKPVENCF